MVVKYVEPFGNQVRLVNDDGSSILAYPTHADRFILAVPEDPDPDPDPGPDPPGGLRFIEPFGWNTVSSEYGPREGGYSSVHQGIDFAPGAGQPIKSAGAGYVELVGWHHNFGNWIVTKHYDVGNTEAYLVYAHMQERSPFNMGQLVPQGAIVGHVGNTGASFGAHLHWETHLGGLNWNNPGTHMNPRIFIERYAR